MGGCSSIHKQVLDELAGPIQRGDVRGVEEFLRRLAAARVSDAPPDKLTQVLKAVDLNAPVFNGATALQLAATCKQPAVLRTLLDAAEDPTLPSLDIDAFDSLKHTALFSAAASSRAQPVADLLHRRANPCIAGTDGLTPLDAARKAQSQQCVRTIEDSVKLWQGWVDHDEGGFLGLPNFQPRWMVVLRDRLPNTGGSWVGAVNLMCYRCQKTFPAPPYTFKVCCPRCQAENSVTPSLQVALYASTGASTALALPHTVPLVALRLPQIPRAVDAKPLEDATWKSLGQALWQGKIRRALQNKPTERVFGLTLKISGKVHSAHNIRVATQADRERLIEIFKNPAIAAFQATEAQAAHARATPSAPLLLPQESVQATPAASIGPLQLSSGPLASQALATPASGPVPPRVPEDNSTSEGTGSVPSATGVVIGVLTPGVEAPNLAMPQAPAATAPARGARGTDTCMVCMQRPADAAVVPCGHLCGCETCLRDMQRQPSPQCPMCRGHMASLIKIYRN